MAVVWRLPDLEGVQDDAAQDREALPEHGLCADTCRGGRGCLSLAVCLHICVSVSLSVHLFVWQPVSTMLITCTCIHVCLLSTFGGTCTVHAHTSTYTCTVYMYLPSTVRTCTCINIQQ